MTKTQQPEELNLEEFRAKVTRSAREPLLARIAELEAQLSAIGAGGVEAPASPVSTYVEVRECPDCGHVGINDADGSKAACNTCEWYGDSPREDKCPGCNRVGTMSAACPKCSSRTLLLAETHLLATAHPAEGVPAQAVQPSDSLIEAVDAWFADNTGLGGCSDKDVAELAAIFATHPTQQGLELANCKGDKWLTVVYRDIQPGDESRTIGEHPKVSALSWSHALNDRDAALAAQAKQGDAA